MDGGNIMKNYLVTSESVTEGHPDKICDQISDAILDAYLEQDAKSRVAIETMVSTDTVVVAGEVTSNALVDVVSIVRNVIKSIGYIEKNKGFDYETCLVFTNIHSQSSDISMGVTKESEEVIGGGDQGIMYGYATNETDSLMPMTCDLANKLALRLAFVRKSGMCDFLYPDGKTQVTMLYNEEGNPISIHSIVISTQHSEHVTQEALKSFIMAAVIDEVIDKKYITANTKIHINPTGRFVIGGPTGDVGLTGRKIMVDTYGTVGKHGGGAFSGKDSTKVDRSAAYMARYVAKNIVAAGLAEKCEVAFAYVIGGIKPEGVTVNTFNTGLIPDQKLAEIVEEVFRLDVAGIISTLELRKPQFLKTAAYGHFGREDSGFMWEVTDKVRDLREYFLKEYLKIKLNFN